MKGKKQEKFSKFIFYFMIVGIFSIISQTLFSQNFIDNKAWVKVTSSEYEALPGQNKSYSDELNNYFDQYNVITYKQALPFAKHPELLKLYEIECDGCDLAEFYENLPANFTSNLKDLVKDQLSDTVLVYNPSDWMWWLLVNDSTKQWLWHLKKLQASKAWDITRGDTAIKTAVIDRGIDIQHPDLASEVLLYKDPFTNQSYSCLQSWQLDHGANVASLVSGETSDSGTTALGEIASIGYKTKMYFYESPYTKFDFLKKASHASNVLGVRAIVSCANAGISCNSIPSQNEELIVKEILNNETSIVVPAGNGDNGHSCGNSQSGFSPFYPFHPSYDDRIIIVSSTDKNDNHFYQSNQQTHSYFPEVDLCAPGYGVMLATRTQCDTTIWPYFGSGVGTSYAAPIVAGVVSLMYSINPCLSTADVKAILKSTTDPIADAANYPGMVGTGRVNAFKAVKKAQEVYSQSSDLYIKDRPEDVGLSGGYDWQAPRDNSPDIWVRNTNDGLTNQSHVDPEYSSSSPVYVYVRVRNKSCDTSTSQETLRLYWTKASSWSSWPQNWDGTQPLIGNVIDSIVVPPIEPGKDTILEFTWNILNPLIHNNWATCLLARIEDNPNDPITVYPGRIDDDVFFNNNIAMKNITILDDKSGLIPNEVEEELYPPGRFMFVGNPTNQIQTFDIVFSENSENYEVASLVDEAEIKIITDNQGWNILFPYLEQLSGIDNLNDEEKSFIITDSEVTLNNIEFPAETRIPIYVGFNFLTEQVENEYYEFSVRQFSTEGNPLGGEYFEIYREDRDEFYADAGDDQTIRVGESANLDAVSIGEPATYKWFDEIGNVYEGMSVTVEPENDMKYTLEVTSENDGYKDYDNVDVFVQYNWIDQITPNPATDVIDIEYTIENGSTASIMILNTAATYQQSYVINPTNNHTTINIESFIAGTYNVILIVDGIAEDSKSLIIQ